MKKIILYALGIVVIVAGAFVVLRAPYPQEARTASQKASESQDAAFATLTSDELAAALLEKDFFFVNVHVPYEGEIKNTDAFVPYDKIAENLNELPEDKNAKIVLYCKSGRMSEIAAQALTKIGYTQTAYLGGGMNDWEQSGYELLRK